MPSAKIVRFQHETYIFLKVLILQWMFFNLFLCKQASKKLIFYGKNVFKSPDSFLIFLHPIHGTKSEKLFSNFLSNFLQYKEKRFMQFLQRKLKSEIHSKFKALNLTNSKTFWKHCSTVLFSNPFSHFVSSK